jgi:hypothetical protein
VFTAEFLSCKSTPEQSSDIQSEDDYLKEKNVEIQSDTQKSDKQYRREGKVYDDFFQIIYRGTRQKLLFLYEISQPQ